MLKSQFQRWDIFRRKKSSAGLNLGVPAGVSRRTGLEGSGAKIFGFYAGYAGWWTPKCLLYVMNLNGNTS